MEMISELVSELVLELILELIPELISDQVEIGDPDGCPLTVWKISWKKPKILRIPLNTIMDQKWQMTSLMSL